MKNSRISAKSSPLMPELEPSFSLYLESSPFLTGFPRETKVKTPSPKFLAFLLEDEISVVRGVPRLRCSFT